MRGVRFFYCLAFSIIISATGIIGFTSDTSGLLEVWAGPGDAVQSGSGQKDQDEIYLEQLLNEAVIQEQVLMDQDGIRITAKRLYAYKHSYSSEIGIELLVENRSGRDLCVSGEYEHVNGWHLYGYGMIDAKAGETVTGSISFDLEAFKACNIERVQWLEMILEAYDPETYDTISKTGMIRLETSAFGKYPEQKDLNGQVLYENKGIKVIAGMQSVEGYGGREVPLYIINTNNKNVWVRFNYTSVNGVALADYDYEIVEAGKKEVSSIDISWEVLAKNGLNLIKSLEVEVKVLVMEEDVQSDWDTSGKITLNLN